MGILNRCSKWTDVQLPSCIWLWNSWTAAPGLDEEIQTIIYKADKQQGPTVAEELYSVFNTL